MSPPTIHVESVDITRFLESDEMVFSGVHNALLTDPVGVGSIGSKINLDTFEDEWLLINKTLLIAGEAKGLKNVGFNSRAYCPSSNTRRQSKALQEIDGANAVATRLQTLTPRKIRGDQYEYTENYETFNIKPTTYILELSICYGQTTTPFGAAGGM